MEDSVHQWGRTYDPPGYVCRNCSIPIAEFEVRSVYGCAAVDHGSDLDKLLVGVMNGENLSLAVHCPNNKRFTDEV